MNKKILEIKNLSISFDWGKTYILKDISFSVFSWEVLSIIWVNWAWKSTLLKTIAKINKKYYWEIIRNYDNLSYVPQKIDIDKTFPIKVYEFIRIYNPHTSFFFWKKRGQFNEKIKDYLSKFWAIDLYDKQIWNLSWWEFQKMLIVSALISDPDLLLLDEPTAWIDIIWEENFYKNIADIKKIFPKISIILVSHNLNLVYKNSDNVVCLHKDNFCCHGTPKKISELDEVKKIFWKFTAPYSHHPHKKDLHLK